MLKQSLPYLVGALVLAVLTFVITRNLIIQKAPSKVMSTIEARIAAGAGGWNACFHNQVYGPRLNAARRANPDSIISSMAYDLSDGPVRVAGETWPRYWSISFYQQNSDNFFVRNDQELDGAEFDFLLVHDRQDTEGLTGTPIVSPTAKGIMLIRRFAAEESDMPGIIANQEALFCGPAEMVR
nr:DUF1254 domain-containing protein [Hyphomonas sp. Mor2]